MSLVLLSTISFGRQFLDMDRNIYCYSKSARSRINILQEDGQREARFIGSVGHDIACKKGVGIITCKMPNRDTIRISNATVLSVETRENVDREIYTLFTILDSADSLWDCSNSIF